jgi:CMP-N,N'-diacetyllegionaminic acid synthase
VTNLPASDSRAKILAVIPARGISTRLPGKNIRDLLGRPMLAYSIRAALESGRCDRVVVSTEDPAIAELAKNWGAEIPFLRPARLAEPSARNEHVLRHLVAELAEREGYRADAVAILQATSPLRLAEDIRGALDLYEKTARGPVASVCRLPCAPAALCRLGSDGTLHPLEDAAAAPGLCYLNGAIFVLPDEVFRLERPFDGLPYRAFEMPAERSVDVDTLEDFRLAERLLAGAR